MIDVAAALAIVTMLSSGPAPARGVPVQEKTHPSVAGAADPSQADTIRRRLKKDQKVRVTDDQGREWQGRIDAFDPDKLVLLTKDRQRQEISYAAIVRIDRPHDTLANGALIGFVSGAAFGLAAVLAEENADCEPGVFFSCGDPTTAAYAVIPGLLGGLGAGIGLGIDALIRRDPALFRRGDPRVVLAPSLGRGVTGLRLSVRW